MNLKARERKRSRVFFSFYLITIKKIKEALAKRNRIKVKFYPKDNR